MILNYVKKGIKRVEGSLGRNIALRREMAGFANQEDFAEAAGIGISTLKDIERGVSGGSPKVRAIIAKTLNCTVDELHLSPIPLISAIPKGLLTYWELASPDAKAICLWILTRQKEYYKFLPPETQSTLKVLDRVLGIRRPKP